MMDIHLDVQKGKIESGKVFSDCLVPEMIDELNGIINDKELAFKYDENGFKQICIFLKNQMRLNGNFNYPFVAIYRNHKGCLQGRYRASN
jgi:hypothetical protein